MTTRLPLGVALVLLAGLAGTLLLSSRRAVSDQSPPRPAAPAVPHPLDPLDREELARAVRILRDAGKLPRDAFLPTLVLREPPKQEVLDHRPGRPFRREVFAVVFKRSAGHTAEAVVDLRAGRVTAWRERPGVQPAVLTEEYVGVAELVRRDPGWRKAVRRRGIEDFQAVYLEPWAVGRVNGAGDRGRRLMRVLSYHRGKEVNPYGRPIEGLVVTVDAGSGRVIEVADRGDVPLPRGKTDFFDAKAFPRRRPLPPLDAGGPTRPGFEVRGQEVCWENWRFRWALHPREGLVLYTVGYEDGGKVRPVLYRAALAEMLVPYADPDETWSWRAPFDEGEYGLGRGSRPLRPGHEVPAGARLFDATCAGDRGEPVIQPRAVALYERDGGILWTHGEAGHAETRRDRQLVLASLFALGNYDYGLEWVFRQDGSLEARVELGGVVLVKAVRATGCAVCRQRPDERGRVVPDGVDRHGTVVARNVIAANHQHFFCFRLDLDVDGPRNSVRELNVRPAAGAGGPNEVAFVQEQTEFRREHEARRNVCADTQRAWLVLAPAPAGPLGHFPAYLLVPGANSVPLAHRDAGVRRRARFLDHHLWVTRYHPGEDYAAGDYPYLGPAGAGLPRYSGDESITGEDVVLWYTVGVTHVPRPEEWPVMPTARTGFRLVPHGFFARNPAIDLPPPERSPKR